MSFYVITKKHMNDGFFAKFIHVLMHLSIADKRGLIPFVDYETPVNNLHDPQNTETNNTWEYCFDQDYKIDDIYNSSPVLSDGLTPNFYNPHGKHFRNKQLTQLFHDLYKKYIKVKPEIMERLNNQINQYKTLGVHCRRSDMRLAHSEIALNYTNEIFFEKTMKIFNEGNFEKIYLATEEVSIVEYFKSKIHDKIFYQDCFRVQPNEQPVTQKSDRFMHRTRQCQEVLLDGLNLSKCHSLLCGISGVSNSVTFINGLKFENVYYFDEIELI